jgi:hypothetical protein
MRWQFALGAFIGCQSFGLAPDTFFASAPSLTDDDGATTTAAAAAAGQFTLSAFLSTDMNMIKNIIHGGLIMAMFWGFQRSCSASFCFSFLSLCLSCSSSSLSLFFLSFCFSSSSSSETATLVTT